ncbi:MAG: tRNA dihydrouridine synthase DusB [Erysipelotrichaceae bacterium]|nr:tRNA dihydrouridine synthase DusB [Erysipelotrichaceae bacterium]
MLKIGNVELKNDIFIGPMAGITNGAFREVCYENGAGLTCTEMLSDKAIYYANEKTLKMMEIDDSYHPVAMQIFGSSIDSMVYAAKYVDQKTTADIIDINMGCPVNKVIKTGAGSAMMKDEEHAVAVVREIIDNVKKPVTVKMRLGFDLQHINFLSLSMKLEEIGVSAIALHGRTRTQMYEGHANWDYIKELKQHLKIPVIGNGDVRSVDDYVRMKNECDVDGIMIARGVIGNPFLIKEIDNYNKGKENYQVSPIEKIEACLDHAKKLILLKGEKMAIREMRGLAPHYIAGMYMSTRYKNLMIKLDTYDELEKLLFEYLEVLNEFAQRDQ